jgi:hypothetical protein
VVDCAVSVVWAFCSFDQLTNRTTAYFGLDAVADSVWFATTAYLLFRLVSWKRSRRPARRAPRPPRTPVEPFEAPIARTRCSGGMGWFRFVGPFVKVAVYRDCFFVWAPVLGGYRFTPEQVESIEDSSWQLVVHHRSAEALSPVLLALGRRHRVRVAIERMCSTDNPT